MASDTLPVIIPGARLELKSQSTRSDTIPNTSGKPLPASGRRLPSPPSSPIAGNVKADASADAVATKGAHATIDFQALVSHLNRHLNITGQPNQFRLHPTAGSQKIQEINPATDQVIGEYSAAEFPALARSLGVAGLFVDSRA